MPRRVLLVLAAVLLLPMPGRATFFFGRRAESMSYYYYPATVYYYAGPVVVSSPPPCVVPYAMPAPGVVGPLPAAPTPRPPASMPYAPREAAPPSDQPVVPGARSEKPVAFTSLKTADTSYNVYPIGSNDRAATPGLFVVVFWNLTDNDLSLTAGGRSHVVRRGSRLTLDLDREFTWQPAGRESRQTRVPDGEVGVTVAIRR